ncbi:hypothetical protein PLICRDRAFT_601334 [Plicaturopsis crispa FD-325 SS-3]|nr:hypothetical protein PLICRDRAFT_601334 [Plicaturopsis crispa FD-325 SS-3]
MVNTSLFGQVMKSNRERHCCIRLPSYRSVLSYTIVNAARPCATNGSWRRRVKSPTYAQWKSPHQALCATILMLPSTIRCLTKISSHICICSPLTRQLIRCRKKTSTLAQKIGGSREHRLGCAGLFSKAQQESKQNIPLFVKFAFTARFQAVRRSA